MEVTIIEHNWAALRYFKQLDERQQRLYLGLKAQLLGWHGVRLVSIAYDVDVKTIRKGKAELAELSATPIKKIRKVGGGPKKNRNPSRIISSF